MTDRLKEIFCRYGVSILILGLLAVVIGWISSQVVWLGDDYVYKYIVNGDVNAIDEAHPRLVSSLGDLAASQYQHYFYVNGRVFPHVLIQWFCAIGGHGWFAVFNALGYILLIISAVRLCGARLDNSGAVLAMTVMTLLSFEIPMTPSMQISYVWMGAVVVWFLYWFFRAGRSEGSDTIGYVSSQSRRPVRYAVAALLVVYSLIAGNSQEAYGIGICVALIVCWCGNIRRFTPLQWCMMVAFGLGTLMICLSPAAIGRAAAERPGIGASLFKCAISFRAFYILLAVSLYRLLRRRQGLRAIYSENSFYWNALLAALLFNMIIGVESNRQLFGVELMSMIIVMRMLPRHRFNAVWSILLGAAAVGYVWFESGRVIIQKRQLADIEARYAASSDGVVYADTWIDTFDNGMHYTPTLWPMAVNEGYDSRILQLYMAERCPGRPAMRIFPRWLRGKLDSDIGNQVYSFPYKPGFRIFVRSRRHPARFMIERRLFGFLPLSPKEMTFDDPLIVTPYSEIQIVDEHNPIICYTDVTVTER